MFKEQDIFSSIANYDDKNNDDYKMYRCLCTMDWLANTMRLGHAVNQEIILVM